MGKTSPLKRRMLDIMHDRKIWMAGSTLPWVIGVTLGLIVGLLLLIIVPRTLGHSAAPEAATTSAETTATPPASASTETTTPAETAPSSAGQPAAAAGAGNAETGKTFFASTCAGCHGANAEGAVGPSLKAAADWNMTQFGEAVHEGKAPDKTLSAVMPHFTKEQVSDAQLADVHTFLQATFKGGAAPTAASDPNALKATKTGAVVAASDSPAGQKVFAASCASCHASPDKAGIDPNLISAAGWKEDEFAAAMRQGQTPDKKELGSLSPRFSPAQLSDAQLSDVHKFLQATFKTANQ